MDEAKIDLSLGAERRLDAACLRFEAALRDGAPIRIEDALGATAEPERSALLRELLQLEIDYRRRHGDAVAAEEYVSRFPDFQRDLVSWCSQTPTISFTLSSNPSPRGLPTIPGYDILEELPRGGMGVVYKARHDKLQRIVAVKMILGGVCASPEHRERFLVEARAVGRLQHPNIVQIHEIGDYDGDSYFSLEFVSGGNLANRIREKQFSDTNAARLVEFLARAVEYAHGQGIIHRDLKPANILLTPDGEPKIADFGLAKILDDEQVATRTGALLGTPSYMAPEQAMGNPREVGPAIDIHALGAILYELLTGRPPFRGSTVIETIRQVQEDTPVLPTVHNPRIPTSLQAICMKCLEKDPQNRYPSADMLAEHLAAYLRGETPIPTSGVASNVIGAVMAESRYKDVMHLWSGVWMGLGVNAVGVSAAHLALVLCGVEHYGVYVPIWVAKMFADFAWAWFFRIRRGPPSLYVERQLFQIWAFFWVALFFMIWFFIRTGAPSAAFFPFLCIQSALVLGSMASILRGSFYVTASLCVVAAILDALWAGVGEAFVVLVVGPAFILLGWKHRSHQGGSLGM